MKEGGKGLMNETKILDSDKLEAMSGGSAGIPLPGVTMPKCTVCGSNETSHEVFCENGKWFKQYKCLICGSYFSEKKEVMFPDEMPLKGR